MKHINESKDIDWDDWDDEEFDPIIYKYYILQVYIDYLFFIKENDKLYCLHFIDEYITDDDIMISDHGIKTIKINGHKFLCTDYVGSDEIENIKEIEDGNTIHGIIIGVVDIINDLSNGYDRYFKYSYLMDIVQDKISFKINDLQELGLKYNK